jgi:hypothetical protein
MNDYVSLLLQGYAAKRELVRLFQPEGTWTGKPMPPKKARREPMRAGVPKVPALSYCLEQGGENDVCSTNSTNRATLPPEPVIPIKWDPAGEKELGIPLD